MSIGSVLKFGVKVLTKAKKAYVKPMCEFRTMESLGLKMEECTDLLKISKNKQSVKSISTVISTGEQKAELFVLKEPISHGMSLERVHIPISTGQSSSVITKEFQEKLDLYNACKLLKSEGFNTGTRVFKRWKPEFGIKTAGIHKNAIEELQRSGAIEKYIQMRFPTITSKTDIERIKTILVGYLEKNLDIYTYSRISKTLEGFHPEIMQKLEKGAVIYMPNKEKSYNLITQMYKEINPDANIIEGYNNLKMFLRDKKGTNIIVLDDCLVSGKSAMGLHKNIFQDLEGASEKVSSLDLYTLTATKEGLNKLPKEINVHYSDLKQSLTQSDYFRQELLPHERNILLAALGSSDLKYNSYCATMFPYMAPNNNSLFSAHMVRELFTGPECAIKGIFSPVEVDAQRIEGVKKALAGVSAAAA